MLCWCFKSIIIKFLGGDIIKIPKRILIGAVEVSIHEREELDGGGLSGSSNSGLGVICLFNKEQTPQTKIEQTFFHELTHQILDLSGYPSGDPHGPYNETFIDTFSLLLHQVVLQLIKTQK